MEKSLKMTIFAATVFGSHILFSDWLIPTPFLAIPEGHCGQVVGVLNLKSIGDGFKSCSNQ